MSTRGRSAAKRERARLLESFLINPSHPELDVVDRGDHLKVTACSRDVATWWLGTLKAVYPQDHLSGDKGMVKMHPEAGVTLQLNRGDGTLRIRGRSHLQWFQQNFRSIVEQGSKELAAAAEMTKVIDRYLRLDDGYTVSDLLDHLPATGSLKHGPSYIYRLWRGLLDRWIGRGGDIYIISPFLDAKRLADALLILSKHRMSRSRLHVFTMPRCDGEMKYGRVFKDAQDMLRDLKGPNKKRLLPEERLKITLQRFEAKFGRFHCKMIAMCHEGYAEILLTSASFHRWNFELESGDTVVHFKLSTEDLINQYLAPLGLEHQVPLDSTTPSPSALTPLSHMPPAPNPGLRQSGATGTFRPNSLGEDSLRPDSLVSESNS